MFRFLIFITSIVSVSTASVFSLNESNLSYGFNESEEWRMFLDFQERFSKHYKNVHDAETRFQIFRSNLRDILQHNFDTTQNFTMGINQFTDLTQDEFKNHYIGAFHKESGSDTDSLGSYGCKSFSASASGTPSSMDWRSKGVVNAIRDQGQCGSCWAFATTANAESVWAISTGDLLDLSEEYLVDCATGIGYFNMGCNGGNPDSAFKYMIHQGECSESSYPYKAGKTKTAGNCEAESCDKSPVHFSSCMDVAPNDQVSLQAAVAKHPVVVAIEADTRYFQSYSGGILDATSCGTNLDHAVEIVGYGTENGMDYWNVRNSWGSSWGEDGYFRIKKSSSINDIGICGIAAEPSFIVV
jgi:C1A family cysteine protease